MRFNNKHLFLIYIIFVLLLLSYLFVAYKKDRQQVSELRQRLDKLESNDERQIEDMQALLKILEIKDDSLKKAKSEIKNAKMKYDSLIARLTSLSSSNNNLVENYKRSEYKNQHLGQEIEKNIETIIKLNKEISQLDLIVSRYSDSLINEKRRYLQLKSQFDDIFYVKEVYLEGIYSKTDYLNKFNLRNSAKVKEVGRVEIIFELTKNLTDIEIQRIKPVLKYKGQNITGGNNRYSIVKYSNGRQIKLVYDFSDSKLKRGEYTVILFYNFISQGITPQVASFQFELH